MRLSDLQFSYPEALVATEPAKDFRTLFKAEGEPPREISKDELFQQFSPGDVLVINDTKVEKRRVFAGELEIVFIEALDLNHWSVLFPAKKYKIGDHILLPGEIDAEITAKGLPQTLKTSKTLTADYFENYGEPALPPYIQKARGVRHSQLKDEEWYQTEWAKHLGSVAAPTASLHFTKQDFEKLKQRGVSLVSLTLHVGLGTFLPIKTEDLNQHEMHSEWVQISNEAVSQISRAQESGQKIWALGTTVCRSLESWALGLLKESPQGFSGDTRLFIQPGFKFQVVDRLLTNFHQPESTLLALVAGFAGLDEVKAGYDWAIERKFRLFSYGDLSVWTKNP